MNTTIKTSSEKQFSQIRRFVKKNKIYNTITEKTVSTSSRSLDSTPKTSKSSSRTSSRPTTSPKSSSRSLWLLLPEFLFRLRFKYCIDLSIDN